MKKLILALGLLGFSCHAIGSDYPQPPKKKPRPPAGQSSLLFFKDFDDPEDLVDFVNLNKVIVFQIETVVARRVVSRLWYRAFKRKDDSDYPDYP